MSQTTLADAVGVTFQQVQKYERGANRVSFSALARIAAALDCRISELVDDLDSPPGSTTNSLSTRELLVGPGALELLESYNKIQSKPLRQAVLELSRKLSTAP
jgi:transcriptional regulator with XRE-family HTH domain